VRGVGLALGTVVLLGVAACGGGGDGESAATDPTVGAVTTLSPTSSVTTIASTTAVPTTTEPLPTTTTTLAPTTTQDPSEALAADVEAAYLEAVELRYAAAMNPESAVAVESALERRAGPSRAVLADELMDLASRRLRIVESESEPSNATIEQVSLGDNQTVATVTACVFDSWILVETEAGPDGSDAIVDDSVASYRSVAELQLTDGVWRIYSVAEQGAWLGQAGCEPA
jgi:hypothetical protein